MAIPSHAAVEVLSLFMSLGRICGELLESIPPHTVLLVVAHWPITAASTSVLSASRAGKRLLLG